MPPDHGRFAGQNRLARAAEFRRVFKSPVRSEDEKFLLIARSNGLGRPRLGLAISRKRVKSAVARNRLKRLIRESFRRHKRLLGGLDIVVTVSRDQNKPDNKSINESLTRHWKKLATCAGSQS